MEAFSWTKFFQGFNIFKAVNTAKIAFYVIIGAVVFIGIPYALEKVFPSKPSVINVAGNYNAEPQDTAHFGCSAWRGYIRLGIKPK